MDGIKERPMEFLKEPGCNGQHQRNKTQTFMECLQASWIGLVLIAVSLSSKLLGELMTLDTIKEWIVDGVYIGFAITAALYYYYKMKQVNEQRERNSEKQN